MSLSDISIRNPVFSWMLMAALIFFGGISFQRLGVSQLPDIDMPVVSIGLTREGSAPEIMETTVVDIIEDSLTTIDGIKQISSSSKQDSATISIEFNLNKNIDVAVQEIQTKLSQIQKRLPEDLDPPSISKTNPDDQPIMWLAVTSTHPDLKYLMNYARNYLRDQFSSVSGVGDLFLGGYADLNLRVWVNPKKLEMHNLTVTDVIQAIQAEHSEIPAGQIKTEEKNYSVRTLGEASTVEDFKNIVISSRAGAQNQNPFNLVKLSQVAEIEEGLEDINRISRFNGVRSIGIGIRKQKGSNAVAVARAVKEKINLISPTLPKDIQVHVNFDSTLFVEEAIHELNFTLILSAILTALACWLFLGSWSATLNVVLSIPTSILGAFIPLYFLGYTLNTFTLLALSLAIGIVVDDAIMVLENIFRHRGLGKNKVDAATFGAREISFAATATTFAIIAIFLPVAFMHGLIGKFFLQFGVTLSFAVAFSLLEALTITPMRCAYFNDSLLSHSVLDLPIERLSQWYQKMLSSVLKKRWRTVISTSFIVTLSFAIIQFIKTEFSPAQDQSIFIARLMLPPGASLQLTDLQTQKAEEFLRSRGEVKQVYSAIGGYGGGAGSTNSSMLFITLHEKSKRPIDAAAGHRLSQQEFMEIVRKELFKIPKVRPVLQDLSMRGLSTSRGNPIEFSLMGPDWQTLGQLSEDIQKKMQQTNMMVDIDSNYQFGAQEVQIIPNREVAAQHGISIKNIGQTVSSLIGGVRVGEYSTGGHRYDIRLQVNQQYNHIDQIKNLKLANARGNLISLSQVIEQKQTPSQQSISRQQKQRAISIFANLKPGASQQEALREIKKMSKDLPSGYFIEISGSSSAFYDALFGLLFALLLGIVISYMILASQFNSFTDPLIVLMALPFSISGAFLALWMAGQSLNMYSMIGLILLMGIVKKNSIMLVEFTNSLRLKEKITVGAALIKACSIRLRPILMTSLSTIMGAIPAAFAWGPGAETRIPMAIAVIGGVFLSTLLTLIVIPVVYSIINDR